MTVTYSCPACFKVFDTFDGLDIHRSTTHGRDAHGNLVGTQRYPATLPPQAQQEREALVAAFDAYLRERDIAVQSWQARALDAERGLQAERRLTDDLRRALAESERELDRVQRQLAETQQALALAESGVRDE